MHSSAVYRKSVVWSRLGGAPRLYPSTHSTFVPFTISMTTRCFSTFISWYVVVSHASFLKREQLYLLDDSSLMWAIKQFMFTRQHRSAAFGQFRQRLFVYKFTMAQPRATQPSRSIRHTNSGATNPSRFVIGTFNVRGFNSATKRDQLSDDLGRLHVDVCCLQETKCPGGFDERRGNYRHIGIPLQSRQ